MAVADNNNTLLNPYLGKLIILNLEVDFDKEINQCGGTYLQCYRSVLPLLSLAQRTKSWIIPVSAEVIIWSLKVNFQANTKHLPLPNSKMSRFATFLCFYVIVNLISSALWSFIGQNKRFGLYFWETIINEVQKAI